MSPEAVLVGPNEWLNGLHLIDPKIPYLLSNQGENLNYLQSKIIDKWYSMYSEDASKQTPNCFKVLLDDLNTPLYISKLHELFQQSQNGDKDKKKEFNSACRLIGLFNETGTERNKFKKSKIKIPKEKVLSKIKDREKAKKDGNYKLADQIRDELNKEGIDIKDEKGKTTWNYK